MAMSAQTPKKEVRRFNPGFSLGYFVSTDLAQNRSPRLYRHALSAGALLEIKVKNSKDTLLVTGLDITGEYLSFGSEIEDNGRFMELADTVLWAETPFSLGEWLSAKHALVLGGSASLPTSMDSRYEGIKGIFSAKGRLDSMFREGRFSISNGITAFAYAQEFKQSPVSGQINPDAALSYSLSGRVSLPWGFRFVAGVGAKMTHHFDSTQTMSFNNFQSLIYKWNSLTASLKHTNGNHMDDPSFSLWYIDEYRRAVSFSLGYDI